MRGADSSPGPSSTGARPDTTRSWYLRSLQTTSSEELLRIYAQDRNPDIRAILIERHDGLVHSLARKFVRSRAPMEDLLQVAWIGLIGAIDRYDPTYEAKFIGYAAFTIVGVIRHYFRDSTREVKAPRRLREISGQLYATEDALLNKLQRAPTLAEMAEALEISEEDLGWAIELERAYPARRLDERLEVGDGNETLALADVIGERDALLDGLVEFAPLRQGLETLDKRRRRILRTRFVEGLTQREVAEQLNISQMQVSRLERSALKTLRGIVNSLAD